VVGYQLLQAQFKEMSIGQIRITFLALALDTVGLFTNLLSWQCIFLYPFVFAYLCVIRFQFWYIHTAILIWSLFFGLILRWFSKGIITRHKIRILFAALLLIILSLIFLLTTPGIVSFNVSRPKWVTYLQLIPLILLPAMFGILMIIAVLKKVD